MFKRKKSKEIAKGTKIQESSNLAPGSLSNSLEENIKIIKELFKDDDTLIIRRGLANQGS